MLAEGRIERATRILAAMAAPLVVNADPGLAALIRADYEGDVAAARTRLDQASFATARVAGQAMAVEQAIAYALGE